MAYLQQGLLIAEQLGRREDEARIRHRLGLALWGNDDLEGAQQQLYRATDLFESIRREARGTSDYKLSLFDLQTASYQALQVLHINVLNLLNDYIYILLVIANPFILSLYCNSNNSLYYRLYFCGFILAMHYGGPKKLFFDF